jgi:hypothetical protein
MYMYVLEQYIIPYMYIYKQNTYLTPGFNILYLVIDYYRPEGFLIYIAYCSMQAVRL